MAAVTLTPRNHLELPKLEEKQTVVDITEKVNRMKDDRCCTLDIVLFSVALAVVVAAAMAITIVSIPFPVGLCLALLIPLYFGIGILKGCQQPSDD